MKKIEANFGDLEFPSYILAFGITLALIIAATSLHKESGGDEIIQLKQRIEKLEQMQEAK